jgi:hypothetical protein
VPRRLPSALGLSTAMETVGARSAEDMPTLGVDHLAGVVVWGDLGRIVAEPQEARGLIVGDLAGLNTPGFELQSLSPGGILIESLSLAQSVGGGRVEFSIVTGSVTAFSAPGLKLDVGGVATKSLHRPDPLVGVIPGSESANSFSLTPPIRIYVPSGAFFAARANVFGPVTLSYRVIWREIPDSQR